MNQLPNLGGFTPSDLENMGMDFLLQSALRIGQSVPAEPSDRSADSLSALERSGSTPLSIPNGPECLNLNAEPSPSPLTGRRLDEGESPSSRFHEPASASLALTTRREPTASVLKRRTPRSKASQLPPDIQLSLNTMLASGCAYRDIIRTLNDHGYPGFNKVNLHNWKTTGYQQWLRSKIQEPIR